MGRARKHSTDSGEDGEDRNPKRSKLKTPNPKTTGRKSSKPETAIAKTTERSIAGSKTTKRKTTAGSKTTETRTARPDTSDHESSPTPPPKANYSRRQLHALGMHLDGSHSEKGSGKSKADTKDPSWNFDHRVLQDEILPAMLPGLQMYLQKYEARTHTSGKHNQDYEKLVRDFQQTMTPLFQRFLDDRATQLVEKEGSYQLVGNKPSHPEGREKPGNTSRYSQLGGTVSAAAFDVDGPGTLLSLESQLPHFFAHGIANSGSEENTWTWTSDLFTTKSDTGDFWRLVFFAVSLSARSAIPRRSWLIE